MDKKKSKSVVVLLLLFCLMNCTAAIPQPEAASAVFEPSPNDATETPELAVTQLDSTITPTETEIVATSTPSKFDFLEIYPSDLGGPGVVTAFWVENGKQLYFAVASAFAPLQLDWFVYGPIEGSVEQIYDPPPYERSYLTVTAPNPLGTSPSGSFYLEAVQTSPEPTSAPDQRPIRFFDIYLVDSATQERQLVLADERSKFFSVNWALNESRYIFSIGGEGISNTFVAAVGEEAEWLGPVSGQLSADGNRLAYFNYIDAYLYILDLETDSDTLVEQEAFGLTWSVTGEYLYYFEGDSWRGNAPLIAYDISSGDKEELLNIRDLQEAGLCIPSCKFAVSPDHAMIAIYTLDYVKLVELP